MKKKKKFRIIKSFEIYKKKLLKKIIIILIEF